MPAARSQQPLKTASYAQYAGYSFARALPGPSERQFRKRSLPVEIDLRATKSCIFPISGGLMEK